MNKKAILGLIAILIATSTGTTFVGCKISNNNEAETTASTDDEKVDIIFDAKRLNDATKEDVDKLLNKTGNVPDSYKNTPWDLYYYEYDNQDSLYLDKSLKCISLSLSSGIEDKNIEIFDIKKCIKEYGLDLKGASFIDKANNRKYYKIKDFDGEVSVFFDDDSIINKIIFYPKGQKAETDLKDEIINEIEDSKNSTEGNASDNSTGVSSNDTNKDNNSKNTNNKTDNSTPNKEKTTKSKDNSTKIVDDTNKDNNAKTDIKSLSDSERQTYLINLVKNNDKNYIKQRENNVKGTFKFSVDDFYTSESNLINSLNSSWGIEKDDYYDVCGSLTNAPKEDQVEGDFIRYLVGVNNGKIIMVPFQGGMEAYQIKDNTVVKRYKYLNSDSYKWR